MKRSILTALLCFTAGCHTASGREVVSGFEAERYMGLWYEVARYPNRFEKNLTAVTAEYQLNPNGSIKVINRGYDTRRKKWKDVEGIGKFKDRRDLGRLKVSFFWPFYGAYNIIHLEPDYSAAIVAGPSDKYLWILARSPNLSEQEMKALTMKSQELGYDRNKLLLVDHKRRWSKEG